MDMSCHQAAQALRAMSIDTKDSAAEFVRLYRLWADAISSYGNGMTEARKKPACVTHSDIFAKASKAYVVAELCYWQRPFTDPRNKAAGIPRCTWERARQTRGLPI